MTRAGLLASALLLACGLAGCSLAPKYHEPETAIPVAYKEDGPWKHAKPADTIVRGAWWRIYRDDLLNRLEVRVDIANQTLATAIADYDLARAFAAEAGASLLPFVGSGGALTRNRQSSERPLRGSNQPNRYGNNFLDVEATYELDIWGRLRNLAQAGTNLAQASAADLETVRLSLHAELANDYLALRGLDAQSKLLADTVTAYGKALELTRNRYQGHIASGIDVSRAEAQLAAARAQVSEVAAQRALFEHAIASLVGEPASSFSIAPAVVQIPVPVVPTGVPSALLQRRPDIAAAERRVAAANADIGAAKAAFYPDVNLAALIGFQDTGYGNLIAAPFSFWSLGPSLAQPIFEGGLLEAAEAAAVSQYKGAQAQYRQTVLSAFQEVEDDLALLNHLGQEAVDEGQAVAAAERTLNLSLSLYRDGAINYLDVVVAQTAALQAEQTAIILATRQQQASVLLIRALGGGWSRPELPSEEAAQSIDAIKMP